MSEYGPFHELQPDPHEVIQEEIPSELLTVPVCVTEVRSPVRTQALPRKGGSTRTYASVTTTALWVLRADHWRASATLMATDQNIYVAFSEAAAQDHTSMSLWPKNVPFVVSATTDVWVASATSTTALSVTTERWAEGT